MPRATPPAKRKRPVTIRLKTSLSDRLKRGAIQHTQHPNQTVPGTPDPETKSRSPDTTEDIELYYRVFNNFRPEQGESNAESADRTMKINKEYALRLKRQRDQKRQQKLQTLPPPSSIIHAIPLRLSRISEPTMEPVDTQTNNAQEIQLQADHSLYPNQDKPTTQQIDIIYDTGAAISMMPAQYTHAWTNSRPVFTHSPDVSMDKVNPIS